MSLTLGAVFTATAWGLLAPGLAADTTPGQRIPPRGPDLQYQLSPPSPTIVRPVRPPSRSNADPSSPIHDYLSSPNSRGAAPAGPLVSPPR